MRHCAKHFPAHASILMVSPVCVSTLLNCRPKGGLTQFCSSETSSITVLLIYLVLSSPDCTYKGWTIYVNAPIWRHALSLIRRLPPRETMYIKQFTAARIFSFRAISPRETMYIRQFTAACIFSPPAFVTLRDCVYQEIDGGVHFPFRWLLP